MDMADIPREQSELKADKPIKSADEDLYHWGAYADNLAQALRQCSLDEGLVVGIEGPWGSGKTSLKNLLIEKLNLEDPAKQQTKSGKTARQQDNPEDSTKPVPVVEFEPWMYSGSGRLVSLMFKQISLSLSGWPNTARNVAAQGSKRMAKATGAASLAAGVVSPKAAATLSSIAKGFEEVGEVLEPDGHDIDKLSRRRRQLIEQLEKSPTRIIVFIDDLDRLMDDEVVDILRAVKAVGDLPHVTYVLLYDRTVIAKALDKSCHSKGAEYLEKIIQVPVELPKPPDEAVEKQLKGELTRIAGDEARKIYERDIPALFDPTENVYKACVIPFIHNMRDVTRLSNEFALRYQVLQDDAEPGDLLAITTLEVFRPHLHRWIMGNKDLLCSPSQDEIRTNQNAVELRAKKLKVQLDSLLSESGEKAELKGKDRAAVESLFPLAFYGETHSGSITGIAYQEEYRDIDNPAHFDAYFRLSIDQYLLHESQFKKFLIRDLLDEHDLDEDHCKILTDHLFPSKAERYLSEYGTARAAKIVGFCLDLESKFGPHRNGCRSLAVAVAIMNATNGKRESVEYMEDVLRAIMESGTALSMPVAASLAADIQHEIHGYNETTTPHLFYLKSEYRCPSLNIYQENEETCKCEKQWLQQLRNHLKSSQGKKRGKLPCAAIIRIYANAIPYLYDADDNETDDDEYAAFKTLLQVIPDDKSVLYVAEALTEHEEDIYSMELPLLQRLGITDAYKSAVEKWKTDANFRNSTELDNPSFAAFYATISKGKPTNSVSDKEVNDILRERATEKNSN